MKFKPGDLCKIVTSWYFKHDHKSSQRFFPVKESIGVIISIDKKTHKVQTLTLTGEIRNIHEQCLVEKIK